MQDLLPQVLPRSFQATVDFPGDTDDSSLLESPKFSSDGSILADQDQESHFVYDLRRRSERIQSLLTKASHSIDRLEKKYGNAFSRVEIIHNSSSARNSITTELRDCRSKIKGELQSIRDLLRQLEETVEKEKSEAEKTHGKGHFQTAEYRLRQSVYEDHVKCFLSLIRRMKSAELSYEKKRKREIRRMLEITRGGGGRGGTTNIVTEEEVETHLKLCQSPVNVFLREIEFSPLSMIQARATVSVEKQIALETHEDLEVLDLGMNEMVDMMRDMNGFVDIQGELIDNIRRKVETSVEYVDKGRRNIQDVNRRQHQSHCCCCTLIILLVAIIVCALVILSIIGSVLGVFFGSAD